MREVPGLEAATLLLIEPVFNPIWTWIVHGERPGTLALIGGALIIMAAFAGTAWQARQPVCATLVEWPTPGAGISQSRQPDSDRPEPGDRRGCRAHGRRVHSFDGSAGGAHVSAGERRRGGACWFRPRARFSAAFFCSATFPTRAAAGFRRRSSRCSSATATSRCAP